MNRHKKIARLSENQIFISRDGLRRPNNKLALFESLGWCLAKETAGLMSR
jgi:hypothetical protein